MAVKSRKCGLQHWLIIPEFHLSASYGGENMWTIAAFVLVFAQLLKGLPREEFSQTFYRDCRIPSTAQIRSMRQRALNIADEVRDTARWMCFGSAPIPLVGRVNSDNIGGLHNKTIVAAYRLEDPYVMLMRSKDGETGKKLTGYLVSLWTRIQRTLKFKTKFVAMDLEQARNRLAMGDVDVLLLPVVESIESLDNFDFTLPVSSHWHTLFLQRAHVDVAPDAHVRAMGYNMINFSISAILLLSFSLWFSEVIGAWLLKDREHRYIQTPRWAKNAPYGGKNMSSWMRFIECFTIVSLPNCFLSVFSPLCLQNWYGVSKRFPTRVVLLCAFIFGYVLVNMYSAVLMSYLAAGSQDVPDVAHLEEIAATGDYVLCVRKESYAYTTFLEFPGGPVRPQWRNVLNGRPCPPEPQTAEELLKVLCKGEGNVLERYLDTEPYVGVLEVPGVMAAALERPPAAQKDRHQPVHPFNKCRLVRMHRRHIVNMVSLMLRRKFPHTTELNIEILRNRAAGLLDRLESKWMGRTRLHLHAPWWDGSVFKPMPTIQISLLHIRTILHTFVTSLLIPVFILLCEVIIWMTPWRHSLLGFYHPVVIQREDLKGSPPGVIIPKLTPDLINMPVRN